jgi:cysteinyl-tRNA synthetase
MTLQLRDTLTRRAQAIEPLEPGRVRMYSCGPTVYRFAHVGNLRTFLLADLIRRALLYHGLEVFHVQNITDVGHMRDERFDQGEDRMLVAAGLEGRSTQEIADAYEAAFHEDAAAVGILPAHVFPRATEHIPEMLDLAERLVERGHAYVTPDRNVYYAVASYPEYGQLSRNSLDDLRAGHRDHHVEHDKRDPADFALWKAAGEGRLLRWKTERWGEGFPGWHLECSAMALRWLGERFDIHTGGIDNVFPHHEDEIAQSAPLVGGPPAKVWVHGEFLLASGRKMAKSAGNFQRITELGDDGPGASVDPLAFRYLTLTSRYRHKLDFSDDSVGAAAAGLASLRSRLRALGPPPASGPWAAAQILVAGRAADRPAGVATDIAGHGGPNRDLVMTDRAHQPDPPLSTVGSALHERFAACVDDDLDLPGALATLREALRTDLAADEQRWLALDADFVLGLDLHRVWDTPEAPAVPDEVTRLVADRSAARAERDFTRADAHRAAIGELGWEVTDRPDGSSEVSPKRG